jgi:mevalonate pyrophosphate decarboxylase
MVSTADCGGRLGSRSRRPDLFVSERQITSLVKARNNLPTAGWGSSSTAFSAVARAPKRKSAVKVTLRSDVTGKTILKNLM